MEKDLQIRSPGLFYFNFRASIGSCPSFCLSSVLLAKLFQSNIKLAKTHHELKAKPKLLRAVIIQKEPTASQPI